MNDKDRGIPMNDLTRYKLITKLHTPAAAKLIYCYLLDVSGSRHRAVNISVRTIAGDVGLSRSATSRNLHRLRQSGIIGIVPRYTEDGGRLSNEYTLK
jgi:CRP-like cAMP-binding protein